MRVCVHASVCIRDGGGGVHPLYENDNGQAHVFEQAASLPSHTLALVWFEYVVVFFLFLVSRVLGINITHFNCISRLLFYHYFCYDSLSHSNSLVIVSIWMEHFFFARTQQDGLAEKKRIELKLENRRRRRRRKSCEFVASKQYGFWMEEIVTVLHRHRPSTNTYSYIPFETPCMTFDI